MPLSTEPNRPCHIRRISRCPPAPNAALKQIQPGNLKRILLNLLVQAGLSIW